MTDQLISFETAKLTKEKGFNEDCTHYYNNKTGICKPFMFDDNPKVISIQNGTNAGLLTIAPTQSLLQKWLREIHKLEVSAYPNASGYLWDISKTNGTHISYSDYSGPNNAGEWDIYEEALEAGLQEALKLIK